MSAHTLFHHEARLALCAYCGAPLDLPLAGGAVVCRYCNASTQVTPRTEAQDYQTLRATAPVSAYQRYQLLKAQEATLFLGLDGTASERRAAPHLRELHEL